MSLVVKKNGNIGNVKFGIVIFNAFGKIWSQTNVPYRKILIFNFIHLLT